MSRTSSSSSSQPPPETITSPPVLGETNDNRRNRSSSSESLKTHSTRLTPASDLSLPDLISRQQLQATSVRKHRSVKSITRGYEAQQTTPITPSDTSGSAISLLPPTSSTASQHHSIKPPFIEQKSRRSSASSSSSLSLEAQSRSHSRQPSVLLASASYPSTLSSSDTLPYPRPRAPSSSSISAKDQNRNPSLKLASAAYPSTYQSSSNTGLGSSAGPNSNTLPLPLPAPSTAREATANSSTNDTMVLPTLNVSLNDSEEEEIAEGSTGVEEETDLVGELSTNNTTSMTAAVHSRNLSVFFPRPGSAAELEADDIKAAETFEAPRMTVQTHNLPAKREEGLSVPFEQMGADLSPTSSRRGHHRRHSVNHGMLQPSQTNANGMGQGEAGISPTYSTSSWAPSSPEQVRKHIEEDVALSRRRGDNPTGSEDVPLIVDTLSTPVWQLMSLASLPASYRPLLLLGALQFILGAALWMRGQSGDSLSLTGLGYLVVFDAFGMLNVVASEWLGEGWKRRGEAKNAKERIRRPYG
jgi:hypothetical protein